MNKIRKKTWRKLIELVKSIAINMNSRSCKNENENENEQTKIHKIAKLQKCHNFIMSCFVQMLATLHYTNSTSISLPFFHHLYFTTLVSRFSFLVSLFFAFSFLFLPRIAQDGFPDPVAIPGSRSCTRAYRSVTLALGCGPKASSYCFYHESHL